MRKYKIVKKIRRVPGKGENIMNKNARKLIPAVAMLLVSATMLSTASFAWFSMNENVTATGMQVKVDAPASLLISTTGAQNEFHNSVQVTIDDGANTLGHASSVDGDELYAPNLDDVNQSGGIDNEGTTALTLITEENYETLYVTGTVGYVDVPLWLATSGAEEENIAIDNTTTSFATASNGTNGLLPAFRFAVLLSDDEEEETISPPEVNNVWAGANNDPLGEDNQAYTTTTTKADVEQYTTDTSLFALQGVDTATTPGTPTLRPQKIIIRIWLEGEDSACINGNSVVLGNYSLNVGFKIVAGD